MMIGAGSRFAGRPAPAKYDQTKDAISRMLAALPCDIYEIKAIWADGKVKSFDELNADRIKNERLIGYLKYENANGANIYIWPHLTAIVLIDDINLEAIERLKHDDLAPAAILETSPRNYQAWLRLPQPIAAEDRTEVGRILAHRYGGDSGSVDWHHPGRLAGFTNRKNKYENERGLFPFVNLIESSGVKVVRGWELIEEARTARRREASVTQDRGIHSSSVRVPHGSVLVTNGVTVDLAMFDRHWEVAITRELRATDGDRSRADFRVARAVARAGFSEEMIIAKLAESPHVQGRTAAKARIYAERTFAKAVVMPAGAGVIDQPPEP